MFDFKKKVLLILIMLAVLILIPVSFAEDIGNNTTTNHANIDDALQYSNDEVLSVNQEGIGVDENEFEIEEGKNVTIHGSVYLEVPPEYIDFPDPLTISCNYTDGDGINRFLTYDYNNEDYGFTDGFEFQITNLKYLNSPYVITIDVVHDSYYEDYLLYGDPIKPVNVYISINSPFDPEPPVPTYETFTPKGQIYVDASRGNDSDNGTEESPYLTIQKALDQNKLLNGNYEIIVESGNYTFDNYYTISNNVSINGRGKVKITNDGSTYIFFLSGPNIIEFKNLIITDGQNGAISGSNTVYGSGENANEGKVLNIINCTFEDNYGFYFGVIKSYSKTTIINSTFKNNYAEGTQKEFQSLINMPDGKLTINYCNFIDNEVHENTPLIYTVKKTDANYNFWGSNDGVKSGDLSDNINVKTWVVITPEMEIDEVKQYENYTLNVLYKYTNSTKIFKDLEYSLPKINLNLKSNIGNVTPNNLELSNNKVTANYSSDQRGYEKVSVYTGETEITYITFNVHAALNDRIYVATYGNDSNDGIIEEPLRTIGAALAKNKALGGDKIIYILNGTYFENNLEIDSEVTIIGNNSIIDGNNDLILTVKNNTEIYNLTFINGNAIKHESGNLTIFQSTFKSNSNAIESQSEDLLNITETNFDLNEIAIQTNGASIIDNCLFENNANALLTSNSTTVSKSRFVNSTKRAIGIDGGEAIIENNTFIGNEESITASNTDFTLIRNNTFENSNKSAINGSYSSLTLSNNTFKENEEYAIDVDSCDVDLKNNKITGLKHINIVNSTVSNVIIIFLGNETVKAKNGTIQINASICDDMGNIINGGTLSFDHLGTSEIIDGESHLLENFTKGDYIISGSSDNFPNATVKDGLLRIDVDNYWFIGDKGYETLAEAIDDAEIDDVIKGIPGEYEYDQINIGHRTIPSEPWVINKQITIIPLTNESITLKALGKNIFDIDYYSNVTFRNIIFMNANNPNGWGGAIHSMGKNTIIVENCTFMNNYAYDGAGIHSWGNLYVKNCLFIDNEAVAYGAGLVKDGDGNLIVENTRFINNSAFTYAGAVYTMGYSDTYQIFRNVTFDGNDATCAGALFTMGKNVTFIDCNFTNNHAVNKESGYEPLGGAVYVHNGATTFLNVNFINNTAEGNGGALELDNGVLSVVNSTGRHVEIYWAILENCLIENNTATGFGGAIYTETIKTYVNITDSIIRNNTARNAAVYVNMFGFYSLDNVLVENNKNTNGDLLIYSYGEYSFPESFYANNTILNTTFKNNTADIVICTVSEYVTTIISDSTFDTNGIIIENYYSKAILTNIIELNSTGNYSIDNNGNLSLKNNTFLNPIFNNGTIDTPTFIIIIGNETRYENVGEIVIDGIVFDDNNNTIIGGELKFIAGNQTVAGVLDGITYKANYTVVPSNQTIKGTYEKGLLNSTVRFGIIIGRVTPTITADNVEFNISGEFSLLLSYNGTPLSNQSITVTINDRDYNLTTDSNGIASVKLELPSGKHVAEIRFEGSELYAPATANANITVNKLNCVISVEVEDILVYGTETINITLPEDATGDIVVTIDDKTYPARADNGHASVNVTNLAIGEYEVIVEYYGDGRYMNATATATFNVKANETNTTNKTVPTINIKAENIFLYETAVINVTLPQDATGDIIITVNEKTYTSQLDNGSASISIPNLVVGKYNIEVEYYGNDKYLYATAKSAFNVDAVESNMTIRFNNTNLYIKLSNDAKGNVSLLVDGTDMYNATLVNGVADILLENLTVGNHSIEVKYSGDEKYAPSSYNGTIVVTKEDDPQVKAIKTVIIVDKSFSRVANDYKAGERGGFFYAILQDINGNVLANKTVQIAINGPIYNVTTDDKGRAGLQVNLANANIYTYALSFQGDEKYSASLLASSKLTVTKKKTSISASNKSFKLNAKTKTVNVKLKTVKNAFNGKTYLSAGKKITFKVNGKTYTAKANSKGVAKFNVKLTKKGKFIAKIKFAGDKTYSASTKKIVITIK